MWKRKCFFHGICVRNDTHWFIKPFKRASVKNFMNNKKQGPKTFDIRMDWEDYHDHSTLNEFIGDAFLHMEISLIISDLIVSTLCLMIPCFRVVDAFSPRGK